ncbi:MAG: hypothetical protein H7A10_01410 [Oceanospirillaceae bacterium]|nr:hypothetical protein [Oceanospirillaceae bacterium]
MKNLKQLLPCLVAAAWLPAHAATTTSNATVNGAKITFSLAFGTGFDSTTAVSPVGGNPASKLGEQRKEVFIAAARYLAAHLQGTNSTSISLAFSDSLACTETEAELGSAAPSAWIKPGDTEVNEKLLANTYYPSPLYAALGGNGSGAINASFNANLGSAGCLPAASWYYGFDAAPAGQISLLQTAVHELSHALGLASLLDTSDGKFDRRESSETSATSERIDIFSTLLSDASGNLLRYMSPADRLSAINSGSGLLWQGSAANIAAAGGNGLNNGKLMLHASNTGDSQVNHLHSDLATSQLLAAGSTAPFSTDLLGLGIYMLQDLGWGTAAYSNTVPVLNAITNEDNLHGAEDTIFKLALNVSDADTTNGFEKIYYDVRECPALYTCAFNGNELNVTPPANKYESDKQVKIRISDGHFGYADKTLLISFDAVNDVPTWNMGKNTSYSGETGSDRTITLLGTDIEQNSLYFCIVSDTSAIASAASINGNQLTLNGLLAGGSITLQVRDEDNCTDNGITYNNINLTLDVFTPVVLNNALTNGVLEAGLNDIVLDVSGSSGKYSFSATLNGSSIGAVTTTTVNNVSTYTFSLPKTGAFAGTYTVTIRDSKYGNTTSFTAYRPLRMNFNASRYMAGSAGTLKVEGGMAGEAITLSISNNNLLNPNSGESSALVATADGNSEFNAATFTLQAAAITVADSSTISASSANADGSKTLDIIPTRPQSLDVSAEDGSTISDASLVLMSDDNVTAFDLPLNYSADNTGHFSFALPDDGHTYRARVSATGYVTKAVDFEANAPATSMLLGIPAVDMNINLRIKAASALTVAGSSVVLTLQGGESRALAISIEGGELVVNETLDLNQETPVRLDISATGMQSQSISIDSNVTSLTRTVTLQPTPEEAVNLDPQASSLHWLMLLLGLPLLGRRRM